MDKPQALVLFGPPGAGKGTQATMLAEYPRVHHFSSGAAARGLDPRSELYRRFEELKESKSNGAYFPDEAARDLLSYEIERQGYGTESLLVLDGIPRTVGQVALVDEVVDVRAVIHLYAVDDEALIERMRKRDTRSYDTDEDIARNRIGDYRDKTEPAIEPYRSRGTPVFDIDAFSGSPDEIHDEIIRAIASSELTGWFTERNYKSI